MRRSRLRLRGRACKLTPTDYTTLTRRIRLIGFSLGLKHEDVDETINDVALSWSKSGPGQIVEHAVIDSLRKKSGRKDSANYDARTKIANASQLRDERSTEINVDRMVFRDTIKGLEGTNRVIAILFYEWGFHQKEIGDLFGVTQSRVSYRLKEIHKVLGDGK